jgi:hypothetical protein
MNDHQTHFPALPIKLRDTGWDDGWEWFQVSPGRYKRVKKRPRAGLDAGGTSARGAENKRKRRTRRRVGMDAPSGAD